MIMPVYNYKCDDCGHVQEDYQKINAEPNKVCPVCSRDNYHRVPTLPHTNLREFRTPIEMYSIAMQDDDEIVAFKRQCPDVDVCMDKGSDLYGVPVARNRAQKLAALKAAGFVETK